MRIHHNLRGSSNPGGAGKLSMPRMPVEWLDAGNWRLPSGKALAEFALQAGFLAPLLFRAEGLGRASMSRRRAETGEQDAMFSLSKHYDRGPGQ
jgi:hypothetical protein